MATEFTPEEIKAAKGTRDDLVSGKLPEELRSIYMAGEIVMWDEMRNSGKIENILPDKKFEEILEDCVWKKWGSTFYNFAERSASAAGFVAMIKPQILEAAEIYRAQSNPYPSDEEIKRKAKERADRHKFIDPSDAKFYQECWEECWEFIRDTYVTSKPLESEEEIWRKKVFSLEDVDAVVSLFKMGSDKGKCVNAENIKPMFEKYLNA